MKPTNHTGQATIELLLILSVLFVLLAISVSIAANQQTISNQKNGDYSLTRNAQQLANALAFVGNAPIGTKTHIFLPPGPTAQTFYVRNGLIEAYAGPTGITISLPSSHWYSASIADGNFYTLTRDWNTVTVQAGYQ